MRDINQGTCNIQYAVSPRGVPNKLLGPASMGVDGVFAWGSRGLHPGTPAFRVLDVVLDPASVGVDPASVGVDLASVGVDLASVGVDLASVGVDLASVGVDLLSGAYTWPP